MGSPSTTGVGQMLAQREVLFKFLENAGSHSIDLARSNKADFRSEKKQAEVIVPVPVHEFQGIFRLASCGDLGLSIQQVSNVWPRREM